MYFQSQRYNIIPMRLVLFIVHAAREVTNTNDHLHVT